MGIEHVNRRGERYILQVGKPRAGRPNYYFGRKLTGAPAEEVPAGYVIYESPDDAQVFLRKEKATPILPLERELVTVAVRKLAGLEHFVVDVEEASLVVYVADTDGEEYVRRMPGLLGSLLRMGAAAEEMSRQSRYSKMMRFTLTSGEEGGETRRLFRAERWCFLGSIDTWRHLRGPAAPLADVVERHVGHLGKESFFDLM